MVVDLVGDLGREGVGSPNSLAILNYEPDSMTIVIEPAPHIASRIGDFMLLLVTLLFCASLLSLALIPIIPSYDETGEDTISCTLFRATTCSHSFRV